MPCSLRTVLLLAVLIGALSRSGEAEHSYALEPAPLNIELLDGTVSDIVVSEYIHCRGGSLCFRRRRTAAVFSLNFDRQLFRRTDRSNEGGKSATDYVVPLFPVHNASAVLAGLELVCSQSLHTASTSAESRFFLCSGESLTESVPAAQCLHILPSPQFDYGLDVRSFGAADVGGNSITFGLLFDADPDAASAHEVIALSHAQRLAESCSLALRSDESSFWARQEPLVSFSNRMLEFVVKPGAWSFREEPLYVDVVIDRKALQPQHGGDSFSESLLVVDEGATDHTLTKSKASLFSRAALEMGFGPDTFIQPIAGSAMNTIMVVLGKHFMGYFGSCISVRFNAFLTGWANDKGRPFVIIWAVMDTIRDAQKKIEKIKAKIKQIKSRVELAIAIGQQKIKKIEALALAVVARIKAKIKQSLALILAVKAALMAKMAAIAAAAALARAAMQSALGAMRLAAQLAFGMAQMKLELTNLAATQDITGQVRKLARSGSESAANSSQAAVLAAESSQDLARNLSAVVKKGLQGAESVLLELRRLYNSTSNATQNNSELVQLTTTLPSSSSLDNNTTTDDQQQVITNGEPRVFDVKWRPDMQEQPYPGGSNHWAFALQHRNISHKQPAVTISTSMHGNGPILESLLETSHAERRAETLSSSSTGLLAAVKQQVMDWDKFVKDTRKQSRELDQYVQRNLHTEWKIGLQNHGASMGATFDPEMLGAFHLGPRDDESTATWMDRVLDSAAQLDVASKQTLAGLLRSLHVYPSTDESKKSTVFTLLQDLESAESALDKSDIHRIQSFVEVDLGVVPERFSFIALEQLPDPSPTSFQLEMQREATQKAMEEAGGLTKLYSKMLAVNLVGNLAAPLSLALSQMVEAQATPGTVSHVQHALRRDTASGAEGASSLGQDVLDAVALSTSTAVGFAVTESLVKILPAYLTTSLHHTMTATITRAVVHSLAPTLMHTLGYPEDSALDRHCYQCTKYGKSCELCPEGRTQSAKQKAAYYYLNFYADYFSDYFSQVFSETDFRPEKAS